MTGGAADRSALVGRTGQEIPVTADLPALLLIPRSSVLLQEVGGALRNHHDDSANNESGQQVRKFVSSPLRRDDSRHQDQRVGDPECRGAFAVSCHICFVRDDTDRTDEEHQSHGHGPRDRRPPDNHRDDCGEKRHARGEYDD